MHLMFKLTCFNIMPVRFIKSKTYLHLLPQRQINTSYYPSLRSVLYVTGPFFLSDLWPKHKVQKSQIQGEKNEVLQLTVYSPGKQDNWDIYYISLLYFLFFLQSKYALLRWAETSGGNLKYFNLQILKNQETQVTLKMKLKISLNSNKLQEYENICIVLQS